MLTIFKYNSNFLKKHEHETVKFHIHDMYGKREIKHSNINNRITIDPADVTFDNGVSNQEEVVAEKVQKILSSMKKYEAEEHELLSNFFDMYHSTTNGIHDICFAEVTFCIGDDKKWKNNFACIVPLKTDHHGGCTAYTPFHGTLWEMDSDEKRSYFLSTAEDKIIEDPIFHALKTSFDKRTIMKKGFDLLQPYVSTSERDEVGHGTKSEKKQFLIQQQDLYTYISKLYGMYITIGMSQVCMTEQKLPFDMIDCVLKKALNYMGSRPHSLDSESDEFVSKIPADSIGVIDIFLSIICYCVMEYDLGVFEYRGDILGEDIGTRFQCDGEKIKFDDPLFEGGDCEDWAQTFMQFIYNIDRLFPEIIKSMKLYFGERSNAVIFLNNVFGNISKSSLSIHMARGIYVDAGQHDQNHTFSVARHSFENHCSFSIIENVLPTFILNIKDNQCETVRTQFLQKTHPSSIESHGVINSASCSSGYCKDKLLRVVSTDVAQRSYKHILWLGEYMMFEFVPKNGSHVLKLGIASYTDYRTCIRILETDIDAEKTRVHEILEASCDDKVCMMIPTKMFLDVNMYTFLLQYTNLSKKISTYEDDLKYLMTYEKVMASFVPFYIKPLYQESLEYVERRFKDFRNFHPDLFMHNKTDSCLYSFVQPTTTCRPEIENSPLPTVDSTENRFCTETVLFESSYNQMPTKCIPTIIKERWNELHDRCKEIQHHLTIYITNCTDPEFHVNNLPFFDFSQKSSIRVQLGLVIEIIMKYLCGAYAKFLSQEVDFLQKIIAKVDIDTFDAVNILNIINSIVYKTMPSFSNPRI